MRDLITNSEPAHRIPVHTPLDRRAVEFCLEAMGYSDPGVSSNGSVTFLHRERRVRLSIKSLPKIAQAAVDADLLLEIVCGQPPRIGEEVVKSLSGRGLDVAKTGYEKMRKLSVRHGFSDEQIEEFKRRAMIVGDESGDNHTSRSRD